MLTDAVGSNHPELGPPGLSWLWVFPHEHQNLLPALLESEWEWSWDLFSCFGLQKYLLRGQSRGSCEGHCRQEGFGWMGRAHSPPGQQECAREALGPSPAVPKWLRHEQDQPHPRAGLGTGGPTSVPRSPQGPSLARAHPAPFPLSTGMLSWQQLLILLLPWCPQHKALLGSPWAPQDGPRIPRLPS